jgi:hypothetical protein
VQCNEYIKTGIYIRQWSVFIQNRLITHWNFLILKKVLDTKKDCKGVYQILWIYCLIDIYISDITVSDSSFLFLSFITLSMNLSDSRPIILVYFRVSISDFMTSAGSTPPDSC